MSTTAELVETGMAVMHLVRQDLAEGRTAAVLSCTERELTLLMTATAAAAWSSEQSGLAEQAAAYRMLNQRICRGIQRLHEPAPAFDAEADAG